MSWQGGEPNEAVIPFFGAVFGGALTVIGVRTLLTDTSVSVSSSGRVTRLDGGDALILGGLFLLFGLALLACGVLYWIQNRRT